MAEHTKIEWCDHTFNPWIGCTKVSAGCANCYAETLMDKRLKQVHWGKGQPRKRTSDKNWKLVEKWNREAKELEQLCAEHPFHAVPPRRPRVFCASLADWLDPEVPIEWLADLLDLIRRCPHLDFLLLTKRPGLWRSRMAQVTDQITPRPDRRPRGITDEEADQMNWLAAWINNGEDPIPENIWIGTSVENQDAADERIPQLLRIPAKVRFLSCEPLLGPVDLDQPRCDIHGRDDVAFDVAFLKGEEYCVECSDDGFSGELSYGHWLDPLNDRISWVICGGESGPNARPMHPNWARSLRNQCVNAGVPFLFKQHGEWLHESQIADLTLGAILHGPERHEWNDGTISYRVGRKAAGRLLDGRHWNEFPGVEV